MSAPAVVAVAADETGEAPRKDGRKEGRKGAMREAGRRTTYFSLGHTLQVGIARKTKPTKTRICAATTFSKETNGANKGADGEKRS